MIERNGLSKLLEVGQQATFPREYRKPVMTSAKLLLQPAANAGELGSVFTNQKRSARPEFIAQSPKAQTPADRLSGRGDLANKVSGVVQVQNFGRQKKVSYR